MSKGVLFFTCALCAVTTAALFAQQSDVDQQGQGSTWSRESSAQQRDIDRFGADSRYREQRGMREHGMRGEYGYRGTEEMEEFDRGEERMREEPRMGRTWRERETYGEFERGPRMREEWQTRRMGEPGELRSGQRLALIAQVTNENARLPGMNPEHQVAELRTRDGNTLFVDLGPSDQAQNLNLAANQSIFARGRLINIQGQPVVMAQEVAKVTQRQMIERRGAEEFSMERPRQFREERERDLYGYSGQEPSQMQQGQPRMRSEEQLRQEFRQQREIEQDRSRMRSQDEMQLQDQSGTRSQGQQDQSRQFEIETRDR